jgi:hypothetical protein
MLWRRAQTFELLWSVTGRLLTPTISIPNIKFTEKTRCLSIRNRASGYAAATEFQASRMAQPNKKRFSVRRIIGAADLWVTEFILTYDGQPSYTVSIMEFSDGQVIRETQYFGDPFQPGPSRSQWVERI